MADQNKAARGDFAHAWQQSTGLLYVLRGGSNYFEVNVTMANGSRDIGARSDYAAKLLALMTLFNEQTFRTMVAIWAHGFDGWGANELIAQHRDKYWRSIINYITATSPKSTAAPADLRGAMQLADLILTDPAGGSLVISSDLTAEADGAMRFTTTNPATGARFGVYLGISELTATLAKSRAAEGEATSERKPLTDEIDAVLKRIAGYLLFNQAAMFNDKNKWTQGYKQACSDCAEYVEAQIGGGV